MRHLIPAVLVALAASAMAADQAPTITPPTTDPTLGAASQQSAINTICPVCGGAVDAELQPISVWNAQEQGWVTVGVDNDTHADLIRQQPDRYSKAARMNSRLSDIEGSSSGIHSDLQQGKEAEINAMDHQGRAGALEFSHDYGAGMSGSSAGELPGKEAEGMEEGHDVNERLGRAGAHEFNRREQEALDGAMQGSSSGMEPGETNREGKSAEREEVDANHGRAGALEFNKLDHDGSRD